MNKVDVTFHPSFWHAKAGVEFDEKFFFDAAYRIEADRVMRRTLYDLLGDVGLGEKDPAPRPILGSDLLACGFLHSQILGCEVVYAPGDAPQVIGRKLSDSEVAALEAPELDNHPLWQKIQQQIDYLQREYGEVYSCLNLMGIQNIALDLRGEELFMDYYDQPELAHHLLDVATVLSVDIGRRLYNVSGSVSAGVTSILKQVNPGNYLTSNCSVVMISSELYEEFLLPYDTRLAQQFTNFGIHHCGRRMEDVAGGYAKVPNLQFAEVGAYSDIAAVRKSMPEIMLCIRYNPMQIKDNSEQQMKEDAAFALSHASPRELLCFSSVGVDSSVPLDKIKEYVTIFSQA